MIQRIQTLYLFLTALITVLLFFFPIASFEHIDTNMELTVLGINNQIDATYFSELYTLPLLILTIILILLPLFISIRYKHREQQVKLCQLDIFLTVVFIGIVFLYYVSNIQKTISCEKVSYEFGIFILLIDLIFLVMAIRGIKKDIELVKSVDRLR